MNPGRLRHRVTFEEPGPPEQDSDGALVETWVPTFSRPLSAEIVDLSGYELEAAQAINAKVRTSITVRYRPGFKPAMRGLHRGVIYNVEAVIADPKSGRHFLTLLCTSGVNDG